MAAPIKTTIEALQKAILDTNQWIEGTRAAIRTEGNRAMSELESVVDKEIARRCTEVISRNMKDLEMEATSSAEEIARILLEEIKQLESLLN